MNSLHTAGEGCGVQLFGSCPSIQIINFTKILEVLRHFTILHNSLAVSSYQIANLFLRKDEEVNCGSVNIGVKYI